MSFEIFKQIKEYYHEFATLAQRAVGRKSTLALKNDFDLAEYLKRFHAFDTYAYMVADSTALKIVQVGGAVKQLTGYLPEFFLEKSYSSISFKLHSLRDNYRAVKGGAAYFRYLYGRPPHERPYIKVNRTVDMICKDRTIKHVLIQSVPLLFNEQMEAIYMLVILSDITELKTDRRYTHYIINSSNQEQIVKIAIHEVENARPMPDSISPAEMRVLKLMADGYSSKQIAELLHLSEHTVKNHRKNMLQKMDCASSSALVKMAMTEGWL